MIGEGPTRDLSGGVSEAEEPALCPCGKGYVGHYAKDTLLAESRVVASTKTLEVHIGIKRSYHPMRPAFAGQEAPLGFARVQTKRGIVKTERRMTPGSLRELARHLNDYADRLAEWQAHEKTEGGQS